MKSQNQMFCKVLIIPLILVVMITLCIGLFPFNSKAKSTKPKWKKQPASLEIGKTYRYRIKHCPKKSTILFSSNHSSLARINRKSGLLHAKKTGSVVITAKIKQAHKETKKLKTHIRIIKKKSTSTSKNKSLHSSINGTEKKQIPNSSSILKHVDFSVAESINPWNHSIMLYSSRILLQSEVQDTKIILTPPITKSNSKINLSLTADFSSLSPDGKTITYQLSTDSAKSLCPGNGTLDGEYEITGNFFANPLRTQYHERIHKNSICGYVLNTNQKSLPNVSIKLYTDSQSPPIASTTTDSKGYYEFLNITDKNITLKAEIRNYDTYTLSTLNPAGQNICQNIIMHPDSTKNLAVSCQILNKQNQVVKNTAVILTTKDTDFTADTSSDTSSSCDFPSGHKSNNFYLQGVVDSEGFISFANQENINSNEYTRINHYSDHSLPEYLHAKMPVSNSIIHDPLQKMTRNQDYVLYVFPTTNGSSMPKDYQMESFSFSFDPLLSDSLFLQIHLQDLPFLSTESVSIYSNTLANTVSSYHYSLYDKKGNELFQTTLSPLSKDVHNDYSGQLTTALQHKKIRLPDGDYYTAITAFSHDITKKTDSPYVEESINSGTTILPIQIQNNTLAPVSFTISPCQTFHVLTYINSYDKNLKNISFILYQKKDTSWFPIGTYTTDSFAPIHSGQKAYLNFPVSFNASYYLIPSSSQYQISSGSYFTISKEQNNISTTIASELENSINTNTPEHQILLNLVPDNETIKNENVELSKLLDYVNLCTNRTSLHENYFSSSTTYPNTVYAYNQVDGTFTNLLLATPSLSSSENISSPFICDRLQNGTTIHTTQQSYSTTPFFVK